MDLGGVRVAWEPRGGWRSDRQGFKRTRDLSIIPITDYSIEDTSYDDPEISYFRLIGRGEHNIYQFINQELVEIRERGESRKSKKVYLSFHGVRMYLDAARLERFVRRGNYQASVGAMG